MLKNFIECVMMKKTVLILLCSCFSVPVMAAQEGKPAFELMAKAVIYATQADAYNTYCNKESALAQDFLGKFKSMDDVPEKEYLALEALHESNEIETSRNLKEDGKECKDVELMISRLTIMRQLKNVSYMLNGIDPETLPPDNVPELEGLLPPRPPLPENKNPLEL